MNLEGFNWRDFLVKVILVLLFVFLLIWLFPNTSELEKKMDNIGDSVEILKDKIFAENIENMTNAATSYYTVAKLPKNVGEVEKLTLGQMLDKKILIEFTDSNGDKCDIDESYVTVTRYEKEYEVRTVLKCGTVRDYTIRFMDLECNLACENECTLTPPKTQEKTTESCYTTYQFSKTIEEGKWTDWSTWSTTKIKGDQMEEKTEYKGRKWIFVPIYEYEQKRAYLDPCLDPQYNGNPPACMQTCQNDGNIKRCRIDDYIVETLWSKNATENNWFSTGVKRQIGDNGYYVYTSGWLSSLADDYELTETRKLYRYRNYEITSYTEYTWNSKTELGNGWVRTGQQNTVCNKSSSK